MSGVVVLSDKEIIRRKFLVYSQPEKSCPGNFKTISDLKSNPREREHFGARIAHDEFSIFSEDKTCEYEISRL